MSPSRMTRVLTGICFGYMAETRASTWFSSRLPRNSFSRMARLICLALLRMDRKNSRRDAQSFFMILTNTLTTHTYLASFSYTGVGAEGGVGVLPMTPPLGLLTNCSLFSVVAASSSSACSWCTWRLLTWLSWGGGGALDFGIVEGGGPMPFWVVVPGKGRIY